MLWGAVAIGLLVVVGLCSKSPDKQAPESTEPAEVKIAEPDKTALEQSSALVTQRQGASVDSPYPLHDAVKSGDLKKVRTLLEGKGMDVNAAGFMNDTPLHVAADKGDVEMAKLLLDHGANVHAKGFMEATPLNKAVERGYLEMAKLLLEHGADPKVRAGHHRSLLDFVEKKGDAAMLELLRSYTDSKE